MKHKSFILITGFLLFSVILENVRGFVSGNKEIIEYSLENDNEEKDAAYESNESSDVKTKPVQHCWEMLFSSIHKNQYAAISLVFNCSHYLSMPEMPPENC